MQRDATIRRVERLTTEAGFGVDRATRFDEAGEVGDRVPDAPPIAIGVDRECLIEIGRTLGVDRDEWDAREVEFGQLVAGDGGFGFREYLGREGIRQLELGAQSREDRPDLAGGRVLREASAGGRAPGQPMQVLSASCSRTGFDSSALTSVL